MLLGIHPLPLSRFTFPLFLINPLLKNIVWEEEFKAKQSLFWLIEYKRRNSRKLANYNYLCIFVDQVSRCFNEVKSIGIYSENIHEFNYLPLFLITLSFLLLVHTYFSILDYRFSSSFAPLIHTKWRDKLFDKNFSPSRFYRYYYHLNVYETLCSNSNIQTDFFHFTFNMIFLLMDFLYSLQ